MDYKGTVTNP